MPVSNMVNKNIQKVVGLFSYLISNPALFHLFNEVLKVVNKPMFVKNKFAMTPNL